jgi:tetratricopeptide (TPR) repeat protein
VNKDRSHKGDGALGKSRARDAKAKVSPEEAFALARKFQDRGEIDEAEKLYRKILRAVPEHAGSTHFLGVISFQRGRIEEGLDLLHRSVALRPQEAQYHSNMGVAFQKLDRFYEAERAHHRVIQLKPDYADGHYNLGLALQMQDKFAEAEAAYRRAVALRPDHADTHNNLGSVLQKQEKLEEAEAFYRRAIDLGPDDPEFHYNLGRALEDQQKLDAAAVAHRRAIDLNPGHAKAHNSLGNVFQGKGKLEEAESAYRRALDLDPDLAEAHYNYAVVHKFVPDDPAMEQVKRTLDQDRFDAEQRNHLLVSLGRAHDDIGDYAEAFSYYRQAMEERSAKLAYDAAGHRENIALIKKLFARRTFPVPVQPSPVEPTPIFVVGMSRSGKTLVESLLSAHDEVYGAGERKEWTNAVKRVLDKHGIPEKWPECLGSLSDPQIEEIGKRYMADIVPESPASRFFVNTLPSHYLIVGWILQSLPSAKIIYCRREPLDHCLFVYFKRYARGNAYSYDLQALGSYYVDYHDLMAHWLRLYGAKILSVQYEELVRDPVTTSAQLYDFCGLDFDPRGTRAALTTQEIGHAKHYEPYLESLREALRPQDPVTA